MSDYAEIAEKKLALPDTWVKVSIPETDAKLYDGSHVYVPSHSIEVASSYPTDEDGNLVDNLKQSEVAEFLREYNEANNSAFRYPMLFEDEALRDQFGKDHAIFDENFERNGKPCRWGYVADFTKHYGNGEDGINQRLVTRIVGYRLPGGDVEVGPTTIAPSGMVPTLKREQIEKMIGSDGLKKLEKLRGREIYEKGDEIVDVRDALGYPQFTLVHSTNDENGNLIQHSHHIYTPNQNDSETVGIRGADWDRHDERRCFLVDLDVSPADSNSVGSFPLVRGGSIKANVTKQSYTFAI